MQLQRLAGYGSPAAYVSAASLLVFFFVGQLGHAIVKAAPGLFVPVEIVFVLALWLWIAGFAVVVVDLERHAHLAHSARWLQVARGATLVALVMPAPLVIGLIVNAGVLVQAPVYLLIYGGIGISLLIHNLGARRTGILHGFPPWLGTVDGVAYILAGIGFGGILIPGIGMTLYLIGFNVLQLGQALYITWAIWIGVKLSGLQAAALAREASVTR
jgi:hypothetical protein